ncbi:MAG: acetylornithine deacetylase [Ectothiorhodospiraceae bacterium]|jgi:acetylornithine deacetylase
MSAPPGLRGMLAELIAIPSVSSVNPALDQGNRGVVDRLAEWASALGFRVDIRAVPGHPDKANLVATLGSGSGGLVLSGHTDTVPYDADRWSSDPFTLTERDGRLYGLGTSDMKSFFALALEAARELDPKRLKQPLVLLATADEESGMTGAKALVDDARPLGRHAVIGEPTGMRPVHLHKGVMMEAVRVVGRSGHSSDPSLGLNALEGMTEVLQEVLRWRSSLQERYHDDRFAIPVPTMNLGCLHAGDNPNRICAQAELQFDLRPLPGMSAEELRGELRQLLERRLSDWPGGLELRSLFPGLAPMETPADAAIVQAARELTGHEPESVAFGTEGPYLNRLGMDTVILGPGDIDQAHQPDEFLATDRIPPTVDMLKGLIRRFCVDGEGAG